ncbi:hypothetical protein SPRG_09162 [Saprolegnia parasitica CBS 223.65]|uniref:Myb/SANT-like domain-containing protein n=1 Tax=Saprolegnia parasitica (strain CBS 223.65) TaxID=695850 RepID=A0A067CEU4_SAPPC|nr:hypothetical protein SPRG_09162 [Saprolegnia parasitica CBS 223.65]KDO25337.1 hypothetical protein SPRG_09162 [Saprolegnia parasitica CBS 223.65]|eukprot:XP_012203987.1 hypothetical protein SPRG_09162 [Saprolegnia parasitica CBS 223.65]
MTRHGSRSKPTATLKALAPRVPGPRKAIETVDASTPLADTTPPASMTPPASTAPTKAKDTRRQEFAIEKADAKNEPMQWSEATVRKLFELRCDPAQAFRFNSKNNMIKNYANECLVAELSRVMGRKFTVKQVSNKMTRMRGQWAHYKTSMLAGNEPVIPPVHFDIMAEYWSEEPGVQRKPKATSATLPSDVTPAKRRKTTDSESEPVYWCDVSVRKLLELRYDPDIASQFDSKNNMTKKLANLRLAAKLSQFMNRMYTVKQVSNKITRLRAAWTAYQTSILLSPESPPDPDTLPAHLDIAMAFWSDKPTCNATRWHRRTSSTTAATNTVTAPLRAKTTLSQENARRASTASAVTRGHGPLSTPWKLASAACPPSWCR